MRRDLTELNYDEKRLTAEVTAPVLERIAPEELTPDQARTIHEAAEQRARALGVADDQARILADAFVASLVTRS